MEQTASATIGKKRVAFCRSGGGCPGLQAHAGMWQALDEAGILPTHVFGNSAGAVASALQAAGQDSAYYRAVLAQADDRLLSPRPLWRLRLPWIDSLIGTARIRDLLDAHLPGGWSDLELPLELCATAMPDRSAQRLNARSVSGVLDVADAVLASMSISGIFPHVSTGVTDLCDGGTWNNFALPDGWQQFDEIWLLIATNRQDLHDGNDVLTRLVGNVASYSRGQLAHLCEDLDLDFDGLQTLGVARSTVASRPDGNTVITALWPEFHDRGLLKFTPGIETATATHARAALAFVDALQRNADRRGPA